MAVELGENSLPKGSGLYWNNGVIYCTISRGSGLPAIRKSTGTTSWKEALEKRNEFVKQLAKGEPVVGKKIRINELLDDYIKELERREQGRNDYARLDPSARTSYKTNSAIKPIRERWALLKAESLTTDMMNLYVDDRLALDYSRVSINRELSYLRAAYRLAEKAKKVASYPHFPIDAKAEKLAARTTTISDEHYKLILQHAPRHLRAMFILGVNDGVRTKELKWIRKVQVNFENHTIHLRKGETKNGDARIVPMNDEVEKEIRGWLDYNNLYFPHCEWLFTFDGTRLGSFKTAWNATLKRAGLRIKKLDENGKPVLDEKGKQVWVNLVRFHDTRRTNVTDMDNLGVDAADRMTVVGHRDIKTHMAYDQSVAAVERVRQAQNAKKKGTTNATPKVETGSGAIDVVAQLERLAGLLEKGLITKEEYGLLKGKVIDG